MRKYKYSNTFNLNYKLNTQYLKQNSAKTGLTIPLQITLSDIKLSGFVILVFSKQKGITVVFRNDPLESLKVSSTFDSIPFVRDYLQKEIEAQLRILFMDELPAIIHRLSLRLWSTEYSELETTSAQAANPSLEGPGLDPLLNPPQDPVDSSGNVLSTSEIASLSLDSGVEMHSLFSRKNVLRLAALTDSQRTLSLFTPSIREVVFRAWTGSMEQADGPSGLVSPMSPLSPEPNLTLQLDHPFRPPGLADTDSVWVPVAIQKHTRENERSESSIFADGCLRMVTIWRALCLCFSGLAIPEENNDDPVTPPVSPQRTIRRLTLRDRIVARDEAERNARRTIPPEFGHDFPAVHPTPTAAAAATANDMDRITTTSPPQPQQQQQQHLENPKPLPQQETAPIRNIRPSPSSTYPPDQKSPDDTTLTSSSWRDPQFHPRLPSFMEAAHNNSGILEQAWMMKMASEIARRIQDEKAGSDPRVASNNNANNNNNNNGGFWDQSMSMRSHTPPPAYRH
ncbi:mitochondrial distribution and morphology protein 34 [Emergomyces africanus]|uniref:Mitochondrial distribution and morphology protein 34 n=1 Tax=Emergomyces africanus TaxID=1955775 RepID=A0A1B7NP15_9EURO|nr:mitochondrial distribution and morphology protein 34 [Emergomyces africanus]